MPCESTIDCTIPLPPRIDSITTSGPAERIHYAREEKKKIRRARAQSHVLGAHTDTKYAYWISATDNTATNDNNVSAARVENVHTTTTYLYLYAHIYKSRVPAHPTRASPSHHPSPIIAHHRNAHTQQHPQHFTFLLPALSSKQPITPARLKTQLHDSLAFSPSPHPADKAENINHPHILRHCTTVKEKPHILFPFFSFLLFLFGHNSLRRRWITLSSQWN